MCHQCGKKGHLARVCRSNRRLGGGTGRSSHTLWLESGKTEEAAGNASSEDDLISKISSVGTKSTVQPYKVEVELNGKLVCMEIDTGAAVSVISQKTCHTLFSDISMAKPSLCLHTYTLEPLAVLGQVEVQVKHQGYIGRKQLFIVQGNGPSLLGRDWLGDIKLDWVNIRNLSDKVVQKYPEVFKSESNSPMTHLKAYLRLKESLHHGFFDLAQYPLP